MLRKHAFATLIFCALLAIGAFASVRAIAATSDSSEALETVADSPSATSTTLRRMADAIRRGAAAERARKEAHRRVDDALKTTLALELHDIETDLDTAAARALRASDARRAILLTQSNEASPRALRIRTLALETLGDYRKALDTWRSIPDLGESPADIAVLMAAARAAL